MQKNSIIIIQTSPVGRMEARRMLDEQDVIEGEDYTFFANFNDEVIREVPSSAPLLIFTSNVPGTLEAAEVAEQVKSKNPAAVVFALTSTNVRQRGMLDGVIAKQSVPYSFIGRIAKKFLAGAGREDLVNFVSPPRS